MTDLYGTRMTLSPQMMVFSFRRMRDAVQHAIMDVWLGRERLCIEITVHKVSIAIAMCLVPGRIYSGY